MATEYVVLARIPGDQERYAVIGQTSAANDIAAIKAIMAVGAPGEDLSTEDVSRGCVAVPLRNWRLRQSEEKVERKVRWS